MRKFYTSPEAEQQVLATLSSLIVLQVSQRMKYRAGQDYFNKEKIK